MSTNAEKLGISETETVNALGAYFNSAVIEALTYGLYAMVFVYTLSQIVAQGSRQRVAFIIIVCLIWALATIHLGIWWRGAYSTFVTHGESRDTMLGYRMGIGEGNWTARDVTLQDVCWSAVALNVMIADLINIWRCWILYRRDWRVVVLPGLCVVFALAIHSLNMAITFGYAADVPNLSRANRVNWNIVYYSVTATTNIITTSMIIFRIFSAGGIENARTYRGLIQILVESALLYSVTYITYLGVYVTEHKHWRFANLYLQALLNAVTAAAPTMIIGSVMVGKTRPAERSLLPSRRTTMQSTEFATFRQMFRPDGDNIATEQGYFTNRCSAGNGDSEDSMAPRGRRENRRFSAQV
ncbi:hypothetical protein BDZ89DRAFT_1068097 [Hymenopellis radicata]|nr:hypothetical protein BDZ89DRAFT_1068097 [Hymenopellis radicata]